MKKENTTIPLTNIQLAYLLGRNSEYELGGVSTHAYYEVVTELDMDKVETAINKMIKAQPMLHAVITENGEQTILDEVPEYRLERVDISDLTGKEKEEYIAQYREKMSHEVFEIGTWPMFSFKALKINEQEHYFIVSVDLLVADGGSFSILFDEIVTYCKTGREVYKPKETFQNFVQKLSDNREKSRFEREKQYWQKRVNDIPSFPAIANENRAMIHNAHFKRLSFRLETSKWEKLKAIAQEKKESASTVLLYLYSEILRYWSNQKEFTINYTLSNRKKMKGDIDKVIGDFTAVMPLVIREKEETMDLWEGSKNIRDAIFDSYKHISCFEGMDVIKLVAKERGLENVPVFPIVFTSMLFKDKNFDCIDRLGKLIYSVSQTPQVYLDCQVMEINDTLSVTWDYVTEVFDDRLIKKMFDLFKRLIESVSDGIAIEKVLVLDAQEEKFIRAYNDTLKDIPTGTLYEQIVDSLKTGGSKCAVKDTEKAISYHELDVLSDQIACRLEEQGIGAGDFVGVLAERKVETIVNIVGVVKSGAAYIPLDPNHPEERRQFILKQSKSRLCLTSEDVTWQGAEHNIPCGNRLAKPEDPAYVIYTSGSTGTPKGVLITNDAVCNTIQDINERFGITQEDNIIGISSYCFDLSVYDIFGGLSAGAEHVIVPDARDIPYIVDTVKKERITVWNTVPAIMELYMDELERRKERTSAVPNRRRKEVRTLSLDDTGLRVVMLSGDWIPLGLPERIQKAYDGVDVYSLGGATEASIWSIYYPVGKVEKEWRSIPYGYPLANQKFYVMNYKGEPCPPGVIGELYIGGRGVAAGYQNDREKTEQTFITHEKYGYLYRTGDYGVLKEEGYIEFKGRRDAQVKIRGHRIELGEIESVLMQEPHVEKAVVVTQEKPNRARYLCAYVVSNEMPDEEVLIRFAEKYLPEYMIPQKIMEVKEIPLTANGKVDKKCLPKPEEVEVEYVAPRNEEEKKLQEIWEQIIGRTEIGVTDNFFEVGGDSISMVKIATEIEEKFSQKISLSVFLQKPTIAGMAEILKTEGKEEKAVKQKNTERLHLENNDIHIEKMEVGEVFPLSDVQMAYLFGGEEGFELGGISAHAFYELETELDIDRFEIALNKVVRHQPMLRAVMTEDSGQKILSENLSYKIKRVDLSEKTVGDKKEELLKLRNKMATQKKNPYRWPLFEFCYVDLGEKKRLLIDFNLLISDGTSMRILVEELMEVYHQPEKDIIPMEYTFQNYMYDKRRSQKSQRWIEAERYWKGKMIDFPDAPHVTAPLPEGKVQYERKEFHMESAAWNRAKSIIREKGVSPSALLETVYSYVLAYWSDQPHHGMNVTVFNREPFHRDVQEMIGDFTSIMLLDVELDDKKTFWENVKQVQNRLIEGVEHNAYDGIQFIRELSKQRGNQTNALMPIVFTSMIFNDKKFESIRDFGEVKYSISQTPQVYLDCQVMEINGALSVTWDYVKELFNADMIEKMFEQFTKMLYKISDNETELERVFELEEKEKKLIDDYNDSYKEIPVKTLYELIADSLKTGGNKCAVKDTEKAISYHELDVLSDQIACRLEEQGIGAGDFVGVLAERKVETIVNIVGVVKSGAAYIPLDPNHPEERRQFILKQSKSRLCLTSEDVTWQGAEHNIPCGNRLAKPEDPAYVIYTSGSTGTPKGVLITNDAVCNTIQDINERFGITQEDNIIGISSYCFDLSVYDIFGGLSAGAEHVIVPDARDIPYIVDTVKKERITVWNTVPAIMELYMDELERRKERTSAVPNRRRKEVRTLSLDDTGLRVVMLSGDWIPLGLPERIQKAYDGVDVYSLGGATEASIWSIYYPVGKVEKEWRSIPYGYPLANQKFYVMNYKGEPCPPGVIGELYIGGRGVAAGYQNDREKTEQTFITHEKYGYLYRTGDYGVLKEEGYIEFKGRRDAQVKIRGHRIELGEIESVLMQEPHVEKAVVVTQEKPNRARYLCAYVVSNEMPDEEVLIRFAEKYLPEYMIPQKIMEVKEIPLTANGKVDKKCLPKPEEVEVEYVAPRNEEEKLIQKIWEEVLEEDRISVLDNYFEIGGDSVSMLKIAAKVEEECNAKISLHVFLQAPTIAGMAACIKDEKGKKEAEKLCCHINPEKKCKYFLFPDISGIGTIMQGIVDLDENTGAKYYDISTKMSLQELIQYYTEDIIQTNREENIILIGYSLGGNLCYEIAKCLESKHIQIQKVILLDSYYIDRESSKKNGLAYQKYADQIMERNRVLDKTHILEKQSEKMFHLIRDFYTEGTLKETNVYYIESQSDDEFAAVLRKDNEGWSRVSERRIRYYKGVGKHSDMLKVPNLDKNRRVVERILQEEN